MGNLFALHVGQRCFLRLLDLDRPIPSTRLFSTLVDTQRYLLLLAGENAMVDPNLLISGNELRLPPRIDDRDRK
jgi:hypothetical protein